VNEVLGNRLFLEHAGEELVVVEAERVEHADTGIPGVVAQGLGDLLPAKALAVIAVEVGRLHADQIDEAVKVVAQADGKLKLERGEVELLLESLMTLTGSAPLRSSC